MKNTIILSVVALASLSARADTAAFMPQTSGIANLAGSKVNYSMSGEANYMYGISDADTGFQNSYIEGNISSPLLNGLDVVSMVGIEADYIANDRKYNDEFKASMSFGLNGHTAKVGYDKYLISKIFSSHLANNLDTGFTKNPIGEKLLNRVGYIEYAYAHQNSDFRFGVDFDGELFGSFSSYLSNYELSATFFEDTSSVGAFFNVTTTLMDNIQVTSGIGEVNDDFVYVVGGSALLKDFVSLNGSVTGNEGDSVAQVGVEGYYGDLAVYAEVSIDLNENNGGTKDESLAIGAKLIF